MNSNKVSIINIASREANIKRKFRRHLHALGFEKSDEGALQIQGTGKEIVRTLHRAQREERLRTNREFIAAKAEKLAKEKANLDLVGKHVVKTDDSAGKMIPSPDKEDKLDRATEKVQETESATEALNENEPVGETSKIKRIIMSTSDGAVPNGATKEENQLMAEATQY